MNKESERWRAIEAGKKRKDERESDVHDEKKKKNVAGEEESARARWDAALLKSLSQLFSCHPFTHYSELFPRCAYIQSEESEWCYDR